ncbi:aminoglycoside adenylyltransferase domain-containing protein [Shinella pollutisoli]|uniref:Aminoglycoside (3'') (9) adenylyltransferase n=1 Tax=Shinella pollutisoli TaxID=2250594 RepID=A0ABV7DEP2_9HYPH|nr:aminoglycoside adenylyltransferase domain-containing protein [Shinella pollutisoli]
MQPVDGAGEIPEQAQAASETLRGLFGDALRAVYLHGSAVSGGLRPGSDVDLLAVLDRPMAEAERESLLSALLRLSGRHPAPRGGPRCIEVMVFLTADLAAADYPARVEFLYGEWLRQAFAAGQRPVPVRDPENTLVLAQARRQARPLIGPAAGTLLPDIPAGQVRRAMRDALPALLAGLEDDARNVLLTLARMWRTAETGAFVAKGDAAAWAAARMPAGEAETLAAARAAYLGGTADERADRQAAVRATAAYLQRRVTALL